MKQTSWWWGPVALAVGMVLAGCGKGSGESAAGASSPASGAGGGISVSTVRAAQRDVDITLDATGTVTALNNVEVRPQVASTIGKVHVKEGQFVKAGALLFTLDARVDEVNVSKARAQLAKDQAALADAKRQLLRSKELAEQNFISPSAVEANQTLVDSAAAVVASDQAAVQAAQVQLGYNRIVAPSAGRLGAVNVFAGSYVQPSGNPLVTITQIDPISVAFALPQRNLGDVLQTLRGGGGAVNALLPEGRGTLTGKLQFVDTVVDPASGTVKVKAVFENREERLWPGAYVGVRLVARTIKGAVTVPQAAIIQGARAKTVFVVGDDRTVTARTIELVEPIGDEAVVTGVKAGERVVLDGRQNVRPGAKVVERGADRPAGGASGPRRERGAASAPADVASVPAQ